MEQIDRFALELGLSRNVLENYITFADKHYNTYYIEKKSGGKRAIDSPGKNLKTIQRFILKKYLQKIEVSTRATGFIRKKGIKQNSMFHLNKRYILTIDIKNFFPSITQKQVYESLNYHLRDDNFSLKLAKICTYKRKLPQGAPTSPILSNIVFRPIDEKLTEYCNSELINYSRYADDLTFSSDNKNSLQFAYAFVNNLLYENGFNINKKKNRYLSGKGQMIVTGIVINEGVPKVKKHLKRKIRAELHKYYIKGEKVNLKKIAGNISYVRSIEEGYEKKVNTYIQSLKKKKKK